MRYLRLSTPVLIAMGALAPVACHASTDDPAGRPRATVSNGSGSGSVFDVAMTYGDAPAAGRIGDASVSAGASSDQPRNWTFWIYDGVAVEYCPTHTNFGLALEYVFVITNVVNNSDGTTSGGSAGFGPAIELSYYTNSNNQSGLALSARVGDGEGPEAAAGAGAGDGARGTGARAADGDWLEEGDGVGATPVTEGIS